ncbi:MAG: TonB-dependent receptor, partial [Lentisphaeria bacterium]|nr:TonB-dependent receptor [Lentisphaeria bacterium]
MGTCAGRIGLGGLVLWGFLAGSGAGGEEKAAGQEEKEEERPFDLGTTVVTGTPVERRAADVTSAVSVIDAAEIEASNADYVMDVIDPLPGVYVRRDGIYGRQAIELRGLGDNCRRIQTLVDGRPEKMSLFGCTVTQTLPLANVERIEVVRGPESILYGSDAMGGVVNIVTRRRREPGFGTGLVSSYGSYGTFHGLLRHGGRIGAFDYYATYDHKETEGHRRNSDYEADFGSLRLGLDLDEVWRLELSGQYFQDEGEDPGPETAPYTNEDRRMYERWSMDADLVGRWDRAEFSITVYHNAGEHEFDMPSINDFWHSDDRTSGVLTKLALSVYESENLEDTLTIGHEYQYQWAEPEDSWVDWARAHMPAAFMDFGPYSTNSNDVFAFNEIRLGPWVNTLGLRAHYDDHRKEWEILPQVGLLYHLSEESVLRAKLGKGFRLARYSELHLYPAHNEELDPEEVWSYELGLTHAFAPWLSVSVNPFFMDVKNLVQTLPNPSPPPAVRNVNSGDFLIRGVEMGVDLRPMAGLDIGLYYTFTDIEDPSGTGHANREGKPRHVFHGVLTYRQDRFRVSLNGKYVAGLYDSNLLAGGAIEKVDNFFVAGAKASYQVHENVQVFAGIENL